MVEGAVEIGGGDGDGEGEGGYLGEGVDAGVGASGALGEDGFAGDATDGLGKCALNGGESGLDLPAVVGSSVVGQSDLPVSHALLWTVSRLGWTQVVRSLCDGYTPSVGASVGREKNFSAEHREVRAW